MALQHSIADLEAGVGPIGRRPPAKPPYNRHLGPLFLLACNTEVFGTEILCLQFKDFIGESVKRGSTV